MRRFLLLLLMFQSYMMANAQMSRWIMQPEYDKIYIASGAPIVISDSAETSTLWSFEGVKLSSTEDIIHPYKEGYAVTTKRGTDIITGFFDTHGKFTKVMESNVAYSYPYFRNGFLLVKKGNDYKFINPNGTEQQFGDFVKIYPFNEGFATCFTYKTVEKLKDPYYSYVTTDNTPISFSYDNKTFDKEDVQFLSSLTDDGKGVVIIKRKIYWFDKKTGNLTPIFAKIDETNIKRQVSVDGDANEYMIEMNDSIIIRGKGSKTDFVRINFNKMLKPTKIYYSDRVEEFKEIVEKEAKYSSTFASVKDSGNKYGLTYNETVVLPYQFEDVGFLLNDFAVVRSRGKWGMLTYDQSLNYRLIMHEGKDIAFRHRDVITTIRLELPPIISADKCRFDVGEQYGCIIDKISLETKNTENGNYVQYKCALTIPDSLPDVITDIEYPVQISYDGLIYPTVPIRVKAWHYKYINVDLDDSETTLDQGNVSFTVNISADKQPGENDYPFEVAIQTDSLQTELVKISETRYKCNLYALAEGVNNVNIRILESGCPPYVFPFEITYVKPVKKSRNKPEVKETVKIQKKENVKKTVSEDSPILPV